MELPPFWRKPTFKFQHPFGARIVGPTQVGKSHLVIKLIQNCQEYISPPPTQIYWAYGEKNEAQMLRIQQLSPIPVHFIEGLPEPSEFTNDENNLLILDDLMADSANSKLVSNLFTRTSHHRNLSVILILQNLYHKGSSLRDIGLNAKYLIIFKNPNDRRQIRYLALQIFPENPQFVIDAYEQATQRPHGYLMVDFDTKTPDELRIRTGLFPPEIPILFIPKKKNPRRK
jgi:hypothetical protein